MTSLWPSAVASLDDSLAQLSESLASLEAARSIDIAAITEQLKIAADASQSLRAMVCSELPEASWQNRAELDGLIEQELQKHPEAGLMSGMLPSEFAPGTVGSTYRGF
jgi:hypothetical protein